MKHLVIIVLVMTFIFGCLSAKKASPSAIGVVVLNNYQLTPGNSFSDPVNYIFIGNANSFHEMFSMTKTSPGTAVVPDFTSQSVVAVVLKPTDKVVSVDINKAEILGESLNVFYSVTDTTSWKTYLQTPMVVATVPKSLKVRRVNFYKNEIKEKTITATY